MSFVESGALLASTIKAMEASRPRGVFANPRADASTPATILAELRTSFEAFKAENESKLNAKADVVLSEKVDRIDASVSTLQAALDAANVKLAAFSAGAGIGHNGGPALSEDDRVYATSFSNYFRGGDDEQKLKAGQKTGIRAAMSVGSSPDGGYLAPIEWDRTVTNRLKIVSPMRDICTIQPISTAGFIKVYNDRAVGSGWVGEVAPRPQTTNPQFSTVTFTPGEIYANPAASQGLLDDSIINVEEWLANEVEVEFSRQEGIAFINGDGVNKPRGVLRYGATDPLHPFGAVPAVYTGSAAGLTPDGIINLIYDLPSQYADGAQAIMNRATMSKIRSFKDANGQYLWQPSLQIGQPSSILGYPIKEMGAMPNVAAGQVPIVFGDFRRGYLIVDRMGIRLLRDPYSNKPYVMFYTTKRVGGGITDPTALRYHVVGVAPAQ